MPINRAKRRRLFRRCPPLTWGSAMIRRLRVCLQPTCLHVRRDVIDVGLLRPAFPSIASQQWPRYHATKPRRTPSSQKATPKIETVFRPVRNEEEYKIWAASSDRRMPFREQSTGDFETGTKQLTTLCQKQVNYWHNLTPLTDDEIAAVKKIGKLSILSRNRSSIDFINILDKEKCFSPDSLYLAAQTLFRPLPASASPGETLLPKYINQEALHTCVGIRFRCFYAALLAGHVSSALWLWSVVSYDTLEGKAEEEMILRCLGDQALETVKKDIAILGNAVKADVAGDTAGARKLYKQLPRLSLGEFEFLWKRKVEYLYAVDEEAALETIISGVPWIAPNLIAATLEEFLGFTKNEKMKVRLILQLHDYNSEKYSLNNIARQYEALGDKAMAAEWHELAGAQGNKSSQAWMVNYFEEMAKGSWFRGRTYRIRLDRWKQLIEQKGSALQDINNKQPKAS